jgi:hypothetical protein
MTRWPVRLGTQFEKGDRAANEALAVEVLDSALADDFAIALDLVRWRLTNGKGARRPMHAPHPLTPEWAVATKEEDAASRAYSV